MELGLLASFLPVLGYNEHLSFVLLGNSGFSYTGIGASVKCQGCHKTFDLDIFSQNGCMVDPSLSVFHEENCVFVTTEYSRCDYENNIANNDERMKMNTKHERRQNGLSYELETSVLTETPKTFLHANNVDKISLVGGFIEADGDENIAALNLDPGSTSQSWSSQDDLSPLDQSKEAVTVQTKPGENGAVCDADNSDAVYVDRDLFHYEFAKGAKAKPAQTIHRTECTKNPGHFAYFPVNSIKEQQLPFKFRHPEFIKFLQLLGILTVRIVLSVTSRDRNKNDPSLGSSTQGSKEQSYRTGTGFVTLTEEENLRDQNDPIAVNHGSKWRNMKKYVKNLVKKDKELIYIETNRHLVFNDEEATSTTVEFFYDDPGQRGVKVIRGVGVIHSKIVGDHRSILVCQTSDSDLLQLLNKTREEVLELAVRLPRRAKEAMCKKLYIINHPHGGQKVLSYGDSVVVKYVLEKDHKGKFNMTKVTNQQVADKEKMRKVLMYAADTCEGSSGAPIFTFKRGPPDGQDQAELLLDVWMHNGVDTTHKLGASVMKVCTADDLVVRQPTETTPESADSDDDEEGPGHQEVTSPVFKVQTHPSYPVFINYQKRLETFSNWLFSNIHSPEYLAMAGFFYAGYADCVRCFQCGLGLRSWKPGDNVYDQHQKHRPNCPYLQAQGKHQTEHTEINETMKHNERDDTKNTTLTLLEKENNKLQDQLTCKVCHQRPIKDLFLPCGELLACPECSKLLTHCPSCNKQILATVTTYFS